MKNFNKKEFNDLVPIKNDKKLIETVNARDLWKYLGSKRQFSDWIKFKIKKYGFIEGVNYITISQKNEIAGGKGFKEVTEYHLSIDMTKHCAMTENTPIGMNVRQYFIERDKILKQVENNLDDRNTIQWINKRGESKQVRASFCDVIKRLVEYAKSQGSENAGHYYSNLTKQVNKSLFRVISLKKIFKNLRDEVNFIQLDSIIMLEYMLAKHIVIMMDNNIHYKEIYPKLKKICEQYGDLFGKEKPFHITDPEYLFCMDIKTKQLFEKEQKQLQLF